MPNLVQQSRRCIVRPLNVLHCNNYFGCLLDCTITLSDAISVRLLRTTSGFGRLKSGQIRYRTGSPVGCHSLHCPSGRPNSWCLPSSNTFVNILNEFDVFWVLFCFYQLISPILRESSAAARRFFRSAENFWSSKVIKNKNSFWTTTISLLKIMWTSLSRSYGSSSLQALKSRF